MTTESVAKIPFKPLAEAVDALNEVLEDKKLHIKTVGIKKEVMIEQFVQRIGDVIDAKQDGALPKVVCAFYNTHLRDTVENARPFADKKAKSAKLEAEAPAETKQPEKKEEAKKPSKPAPAPEKKTTSTPAPATPTSSGKKMLFKKPAASGSKPVTGKPLTRKQQQPTQVVKKTGLKSDVPPSKKDGKKTSTRRGSGMVKRLVGLYVIDGITDTQELAKIIDKEYPNTKNRSTIGHVRCILGNIPEGHLITGKLKSK